MRRFRADCVKIEGLIEAYAYPLQTNFNQLQSLNWLQVLLIGVTSCNVRSKGTPMRLVQLWSARAQHAVIRRIPSNTLPQYAVYFSDGPTHGYCSWLTLCQGEQGWYP